MTNEVSVAQRVVNNVSALEDKQNLQLPANYDVSKAVNMAVLAMKNSTSGDLTQKATPDSQTQAILDMVLQGLYPQQTQGYFILYGQQVKFQRSYFGTQAALKRLNSIDGVRAVVVHAGDNFEIGFNDEGELIVEKHETKFENLDNEIIGVYAVIDKADGTKVYEVMTKKMIEASWSQARTNNVQKKFPEEMAKRTVINRAAKNILNSSLDEDVDLIGAINSSTEAEADHSRKEVEGTETSSTAKKLLNKIAKKPDEAPKQVETPIEDKDPEPEEKAPAPKKVARKRTPKPSPVKVEPKAVGEVALAEQDAELIEPPVERDENTGYVTDDVYAEREPELEEGSNIDLLSEMEAD